MKKKCVRQISIIILIALILTCSVSNIIYLIHNQGAINFVGSTLIFKTPKTIFEQRINGLLFLFFILVFTVAYLIICKSFKDKKDEREEKNQTNSKDEKDTTFIEQNNNEQYIKNSKENNKNFKKMIGLIALISILAAIIIPNNSTDVYYYMATGRLSSKYNIDTFNTLFDEEQKNYQEDDVIQSSSAWNIRYAYGPLYWLISRTLSSLPIHTLGLLYVYKLLNVIVHLINCLLIYKISKKNKVRNMLLYGLNPLVIFEGIINCHNDMFLVLSILVAFYLKKKNKMGLAVFSLALGALVKYIPVLVLPLILKKESKAKTVAYLCEFGVIYLAIAFPIVRSINGLFLAFQQASFLANSLYLQLYLLRVPSLDLIGKTGKALFIIIYIICIFKFNEPKTYKTIFMLFMLLVLTNFRTWYIIWLFALLPILDEDSSKDIIALSLIGEASNIVMYRLGESYIYGQIYFNLVVITMMIYYLIKEIIKKNKLKTEKLSTL